MNAAVSAQDVAGFVVEHPVARGGGGAPGDERAVVVVRDGTDFLAVRLVGDRQPVLPRVLADLLLRQGADPEDRARGLLLRGREEEIRLVLRPVEAAPQKVPAAGAALHARIVAGGDRIGAEAA